MKEKQKNIGIVLSCILFILFISCVIYLLYLSYTHNAETLTDYTIFRPEAVQVFAENFFPLLPITAFSAFIVLLIYFIRSCYRLKSRDTCLVIPQKLQKRMQNNTVFAICGNAVFFLFYISLANLSKENYFQRPLIHKLYKDKYTFFFLMISDLIMLSVLLYRSFKLKHLLLKVPSGINGGKVKQCISLSPYLLLAFLLFNHVYMLGLIFLEDIRSINFLVLILNLSAVIWVFFILKVNNACCTRERYAFLSEMGFGIGSGLGAYRFSFVRNLILNEFFSYLLIFIIYVIAAFVALALFWPLGYTDSGLS